MRVLLLVALMAVPVQEKKRTGGWLGLRLDETAAGLKVEAVVAGSAAEQAGYKAGDVIVKFEGKAFANGDEFFKSLWMWPGKTPPTVTVRRSDADVEIKAGLAELDAKPAVGEAAPDFTLKTPDGKSEVKLADLVGKKPAFLIFGSWT